MLYAILIAYKYFTMLSWHGVEVLGLGLVKKIMGYLWNVGVVYSIATLPLWVFVCKQNQATDCEKKVSWTLTRDENFNFRAALWTDLHGLLFNALPSNIFFWGHLFLSFCVSDDKTSVKVKAKVLQTDETIEIVGNLLVAADGSLSSIRQSFFTDFKLRFVTKFESKFV